MRLDSRVRKLEDKIEKIDESKAVEREFSIRDLTVNKRQITQAMYKQFIEEDIIDYETRELKGEILGWVNLHAKCPSDRHLHIVWLKNGKPRKFCTPFECKSEEYLSDQKDLLDLADAYVCCMVLEEKHDKLNFAYSLTTQGNNKVYYTQLKIKNREMKAAVSRHAAIKSYDHYVGSARDDAIVRLRFAGNSGWTDDNDFSSLSSDMVYAMMEKLIDKMDKMEQEWEQAYRSLENTEQIFIAPQGPWK